MLRKERILLFFMMSTIVLFDACEKEPTPIGVNILPQGTTIPVQIDSSAIAVGWRTVRDSINYIYGTNHGFFGSMYDDYFGITTCDFASELYLTTTNPNLENANYANSLNLILELDENNYYGDTETPVSFKVYEILETIDESIFTNLTKDVKPIGVFTDTIRPDDTTQITIPLSTSLAHSFLNSEDSVFYNNTNFTEFFKGIYIASEVQTDLNKGAIYRFDFESSNTRVEFEYVDENDDTVKVLMNFANTSDRGTIFHHDYSVSSVLQASPTDTSIYNEDDTAIYLHALGGLRAQLDFDGLPTDWGDSVTINKAELRLDVATGTSDSVYLLPSAIQIFGFDDEGNRDFLIDYYSTSSGVLSYLGEYYNASENAYIFDISVYYQQKINEGNNELQLSFKIYDNTGNARRVVLNTGQTGIDTRIHVIYTKY